MNKEQFLQDLDREYAEFEKLLNEIGESRMEQPGVAGHWSVKDVVAHLTAWRRRTVQRFEALASGKPLAPKPWPEDLADDDSINAWLHERERGKPLGQVLAESRQVFGQLRAAIAATPEATLSDRNNLPWLEGNDLTAAVLFSHFHDGRGYARPAVTARPV
jgi:hypothetical protein